MSATSWRFVGFNVPQGLDLVLARLQLLDAAGSAIPVSQVSCSHVPVSGALAGLPSGGGAVRFAGTDAAQPGFYIQFDAAAPVDIARIKIAGVSVSGLPVAVTACEGSPWVPKLSYRGITYDANLENIDGRTLDPYLAQVSMLVWPTGTRLVDHNVNQVTPWAFAGGVADLPSAGAVAGRTLRFPVGGNAWLAAPSSAALELGSGDFTFEARIKTSKSGDMALLDKYNSSSSWQMMLQAGKLAFWIGSYWSVGVTAVNDGAYHDVAIERFGNRLRGYVNGRLEGDIAFNAVIPDNGFALAIGAQVASRNSSYDFVGDIDYVRMTLGLARYSSVAGYTPPRALPVVPQEAAAYWDGFASLARMASIKGEDPIQQGLQAVARHSPSKLLDVECGGQGRIYGTVARKSTPANVPLRRRVRLHRSVDGYLARETWSKADGSYEFREINERYEYDVIAWDHEMQEFSTVANNQLAEVMP